MGTLGCAAEPDGVQRSRGVILIAPLVLGYWSLSAAAVNHMAVGVVVRMFGGYGDRSASSHPRVIAHRSGWLRAGRDRYTLATAARKQGRTTHPMNRLNLCPTVNQVQPRHIPQFII